MTAACMHMVMGGADLHARASALSLPRPHACSRSVAFWSEPNNFVESLPVVEKFNERVALPLKA
jgi:hypothetical protein